MNNLFKSAILTISSVLSISAMEFPLKTHSYQNQPIVIQTESVAKSAKYKKRFTPEEDALILAHVTKYGLNAWAKLTQTMKGRSNRILKERYINYLAPSINRSKWTPEEDELLMGLHRKFGSKWTQIRTFFDNRTDIALKNRFNFLERRSERQPTTSMEIPNTLPAKIEPEYATIFPEDNFEFFSFFDDVN